MPPRKGNAFRKYFCFRDGYSICIVPKADGNTSAIVDKDADSPDTDEEDPELCNMKLAGDHNSNLRRHISTHHPNTFTLIETQLESAKRENACQASNDAIFKKFKSSAHSAATCSKAKQLQMYEFGSLKNTVLNNVRLSFRDIELSMLMSITIDGRPIYAVEDMGYSHLIQKLVPHMPDAKAVNYVNAVRLLSNSSAEIKQRLRTTVKGCLISLKIDSATYYNRTFLGVMLQFRRGIEKFQSYTISCEEVNNSLTAGNLRKIIVELLEKFDISLNQVVSVTSDCATNMVTSVKELNKYKTASGIRTNSTVLEGCPGTSDNLQAPADDWDTFEIEEAVEDVIDANESVTEPETAEFISLSEVPLDFIGTEDIEGLKCAVHVLQLAIVVDWLPDLPFKYKRVIEDVRELVKATRTRNVRNALRKEGCKLPPIECKTRWNSMLFMLDGFLSMYSVLQKISHLVPRYREYKLDDNRISLVRDLVVTLKPLASLTATLSKNDLIPTDGFTYWLKAKLHLRKLSTDIAASLLQNIETREKNIFKTRFFFACQFLDPRYKSLLNNRETQKAIELIHNCHQKLLNVENNKTNTDSFITIANTRHEKQGDNSHVLPSDGPTDLDELDEFVSDVLRSTEVVESRGTDVESKSPLLLLEQELEIFKKEPRISSTEDIKQFWKAKEASFPYLYKIVCALYGAPLTEVDVERLFSNVRFILNYLRTSLKKETFEDIMFVRTNFDLLLSSSE